MPLRAYKRLPVREGSCSVCKTALLGQLDWTCWLFESEFIGRSLRVRDKEGAWHVVRCADKRGHVANLLQQDGELYWLVSAREVEVKQ